MPAEIERIDPHSLEIVIIEKFKTKVKEIKDFATENSQFDDGTLPDPNESVLTPYKNGVHFSDRECPTHGSEEFYSITESETGETVTFETVIYEKAPDQRIDILKIASGQIKVKEGTIQSHNLWIIERAIEKLNLIKESIFGQEEDEQLGTPPSQLDTPASPPLN